MTMEIGLARRWQEAFWLELAQRCDGRAQVVCQGKWLRVEGMTLPAVAEALAALFPLWQQAMLKRLAWRLFPAWPADRRQQVTELATAWALAGDWQGRAGPLSLWSQPAEGNHPAGMGPEQAMGLPCFAGVGSEQRLIAALMKALAAGPLDWAGFCRFRLPGHSAWLELLLLAAAGELDDREEEGACLRLLKQASQACRQGPELHLFFSPPGRFHLWRRDEKGIRQVEGGCCLSAEPALLANLIASRPRRLILHEDREAPQSWLTLLSQVFEERLERQQ